MDKIIIVNFKDKSSNWWVDGAHYNLNENDEITFCSGGISSESKIGVLRQFIFRNKKVYQPREISPYINKKEYLEVITFGKHSGKSVSCVFDEDKGYLSWMIKNYDFSRKEKLKAEIIQILK